MGGFLLLWETGEGAVKRRAKASPPDSWLEIEDKTITLNGAATAKFAAELPKIFVVADEETPATTQSSGCATASRRSQISTLMQQYPRCFWH